MAVIEPSFRERADALSSAVFISRAPDRTKYLKRKKIPEYSLAVVYADAMIPFLKTYCTAVAESKADAEVSARFGWKTLDELRAEAYTRAKVEFGI